MRYLVDINVAVYNHALFLRQTLDSILNQKTSFDFRVLIGDDCSTDGSIDILREYELKYPEIVSVIYQPVNLGLHAAERNGLVILRNSTAKYIAFCDGDDYWTDDTKLQRQVDTLENDSTVAACGHNVNVLYVGEDKIAPSESNVLSVKRKTIDEAGFSMPCHTCSLVMRNTPLFTAQWLPKISVGDWPLISLALTNGDLIVLPEIMGVYRQNTGVWSSTSRSRQIKGILQTVDAMTAAPEFAPFPQFRRNLTYTKIKYLHELHTSQDAKEHIDGVSEMSIIDYYDNIVSELQTAFQDKNELAARAPFGTLIKALFTKFNRKIKI